MSALSLIAPKLAKLMPRLGSNHDWEVVATVHAIDRLLKSAGLDFHSLAEAVEVHRPQRPAERRPTRQPTEAHPMGSKWLTWLYVVTCRDNIGQLSSTEAAFVRNLDTLLQSGRRPSLRQAEWVRDLANRIKPGAA